MDDKLTKALRVWAEQEHIVPSSFAAKTGYSYQHAYNLLKGGGKVSDETLGRISRTFGVDAVREIMVLERGV
jgi:plasmid maintenance system antidote protein VapI